MTHAAGAQVIEPFRQAMRRVASTVNVITLCVNGKPMGITATAMSSLSMDPPSLLVCINRAARVHEAMEKAALFGVNVLHHDHAHLAQMFADSRKQDLRFLSGWAIDRDHPPRLLDAQASLLCRRTDHHRFGSHSIFIGVVVKAFFRSEVAPLVYADGRYCDLKPVAEPPE